MFDVVNDHVFSFLRTLGPRWIHLCAHMKDARFTFPAPARLAKLVDMIDGISMENRDTKGDLHKDMLGKIAAVEQNGPFHTRDYIIQFVVELPELTGKDVICDPACGTGWVFVDSA